MYWVVVLIVGLLLYATPRFARPGLLFRCHGRSDIQER